MNRMVAGYQVFLDWLEYITYAVAMVLMFLLFLNTSIGVINDVIFSNSLIWVEEINNLLFAWVCFLGAGAISRRGGHIGVDMLYQILSPKFQKMMQVLYTALALIIVWVMVYFGIKMANFVGRYQTSLYLDISLFYYYLAVPAGGLLLGLNSIGVVLSDPGKLSLSPGSEET